MSEHETITTLNWFPKQFRAGDMDGTGGDRLLGRTDLAPLEVLVRETAQNSWDARRDGATPHFGLHLRRVDFRLRADLNRLFEGSRRPGRQRTPEATNLHVLEVFDRGTSGLDGPTDLSPVASGVPCNYQDLILKVGVPRDDGKGGGTYGFGKTAAYAFSEQGTVIFWTRCHTPGVGLEHRFVISAFHDSYVSEGKQFTGRHWWGDGRDDLVEPLKGERARMFGERFFSRRFEGDETGTSLLILDPKITVPWNTDSDAPDVMLRRHGDSSSLEATFAAEARRAVRQHLWPKLVPEPGHNSPPMPISLRVHEDEVDILDLAAGAITSWGAGLNAIRTRVSGSDTQVVAPSGLPVEVHDVTRLGKTIGHLAVVKRMRALEGVAQDDDLDPTWEEGAVQRIALMRDQAELVVTTDDWSDHTASPVFDWLAVFKSASDWDSVFADAEPPAHDMWVSSAGGETGLVIRAMRNKVRAILRDVFAVPDSTSIVSPGDNHHGVRAVARMFGMLLPAVDQGAEDSDAVPKSLRSGGRRGRRQMMSVDAPRLLETLPDGRQRQKLTFSVSELGDHVVEVSVSVVGDDGARSELPPADLALDWSHGSDLGDGRAVVPGEIQQAVALTGPPRRALRIEMNARPVNARD
ncbi:MULTISPECIES: hypothetical protein [unclassified Microbacterium]|uniref:hypothetical protein n=1 Tax=unclassified Microbacterium TaxID=2609290 RepID=UPI0012F94ED3|nr:hypothetical protein [Microbacterium sp. MAH-37]MVQ41439.1 hypothetical protein [Microbacterium sp. MAH-37]